jgi:hypothetical protein
LCTDIFYLFSPLFFISTLQSVYGTHGSVVALLTKAVSYGNHDRILKLWNILSAEKLYTLYAGACCWNIARYKINYLCVNFCSQPAILSISRSTSKYEADLVVVCLKRVTEQDIEMRNTLATHRNANCQSKKNHPPSITNMMSIKNSDIFMICVYGNFS